MYTDIFDLFPLAKQELPRDGPKSDLLWSVPDNEVKSYGFSPTGEGYLIGKVNVKNLIVEIILN